MKFVPKGWGWERWIVNEPKYCLKEMFCAKGRKCSLHYHNVKDETFYVTQGKLRLFLYKPEHMELSKSIFNSPSYILEHLVYGNVNVLNIGDSIRILPSMIHFFYAIEDTKFFEVSTQHFEEDSIRILKGD